MAAGGEYHRLFTLQASGYQAANPSSGSGGTSSTPARAALSPSA